jgi:hypothetical protein
MWGIALRPAASVAWLRFSCGLRLALDRFKEVVLDEEFRLCRPRLTRLSSAQQAEAVELLARMLLDAAIRSAHPARGQPRVRRPVASGVRRTDAARPAKDRRGRRGRLLDDR